MARSPSGTHDTEKKGMNISPELIIILQNFAFLYLLRVNIYIMLAQLSNWSNLKSIIHFF